MASRKSKNQKWQTGYDLDGKFTAFAYMGPRELNMLKKKLQLNKIEFELLGVNAFGETRIVIKSEHAVNAVKTGFVPKPQTLKLPAELSEDQKKRIMPPLKLLFNDEIKKQNWETGYSLKGELQTSLTTTPENARMIYSLLKAQKLDPAALALSESEYRVTLTGMAAKLAVKEGLAAETYKGQTLQAKLSPALLSEALLVHKQHATQVKA